ncbi:MAG: hypothetical protein LUH05_08610 [Candidatus Gastranaerophilales bacterium]|nr:hypothetical protein [Candidatus Gastranaerophilales bacterium]
MFTFRLTTIEKLTKFIIKALAKAIKAGNKIITLYDDSESEIVKLKEIIQQFEQIKTQLESKTTADDTEEIILLAEENSND